MNPVCRILILDDLFGSCLPDRPNADRENLCAHFLWQDATGDDSAKASKQKVLQPTAEAVFFRAQSPACSEPGDTVENDLEKALTAVRYGWPSIHQSEITNQKSIRPWVMVLIDLCFYTGRVTEESHRRTPGMPEGRPGDDDPRSYFGLTLLDAIHHEFPELPIFILSSKPREDVSMDLSRRGALGFIDRSALDGPEQLERALLTHGLLEDPYGEIVGRSLPLLLALREARRSALHKQHVLIGGERGSGKELLARYIHRHGGKGRPFVPVNSAIFTPQLFASEFFGIEAGTATGVNAKSGLMEQAEGGDLFLDEIADLPREAQASILRFLQDGKYQRVGGKATRQAQVRILAATNQEIHDIESGFRADLVDRLRSGGHIALPPLRERRKDIPLLVDRFVSEAQQMNPGARPREVTSDALELLLEHDWPGNIRELRTAVLDAVNRYPDMDYLVPDHLRIQKPSRQSTAQSPSTSALSQAKGQKTVYDSASPQSWAGKLPDLERDQARDRALLLAAALEATKRHTAEQPGGRIQIQPAARLATGDGKLTASKAADLFKRHLGILEDELEGDLKEAYETALRLRPKASRSAIP